MDTKFSLTKILLNQIEMASSQLGGRSPTVLSCGGIYLARKKTDGLITSYQILNLANEEEPTKVFIKQPAFRNQLHQVLFKESLN